MTDDHVALLWAAVALGLVFALGNGAMAYRCDPAGFLAIWMAASAAFIVLFAVAVGADLMAQRHRHGAFVKAALGVAVFGVWSHTLAHILPVLGRAAGCRAAWF